MEKVAIIGGGASAVMAAITCQNKTKTTIFCKDDSLLKKVLASGNGRCNLQNININSKFYNQNIDVYLNQFSQQQTRQFFENLDVCTYADEQGRVYPLSNSAFSVKNALQNALNCKIEFGAEVQKIEPCQNGYNVFYGNFCEFFSKVIVATGGNTAHLFANLNIKAKQPTKSLCALKTKQNTFMLNGKRYAGVKVACQSLGFEECGEVLFKDEGISGICIFNLSFYMSKQEIKKTTFAVDFLPQMQSKTLQEFLTKPNKTILNLLLGVVDLPLCKYVLNIAKIDGNTYATKEQAKTVANLIKNMQFETNGTYNNNQTTNGGICLNQLTNSLESKQHKNLFFAGEVVDVDGACGGYNLQWAWTSGRIVGEALVPFCF